MQLLLKLAGLGILLLAAPVLAQEGGPKPGGPQLQVLVDLGQEVMYPAHPEILVYPSKPGSPPPPGGRMGALIGGAAGSRWLKAGETAATLKGGERYRLYTLSGAAGEAGGGPPQSQKEDFSPPFPEYLVALTPVPDKRTDLLALSGNGNAMPRVPRPGSTDDPVCREAAARLLKAKGLANPKVKLTQVLYVDLDGDGREEVLVSATNFAQGVRAGALIRPGDYSLVFLLRQEQGKAQTILLEGEFFPGAKDQPLATAYQVCGVLDLNGDGVLEVVVRYRYYEGAGTLVYQVQGSMAKRVLECGWGS